MACSVRPMSSSINFQTLQLQTRGNHSKKFSKDWMIKIRFPRLFLLLRDIFGKNATSFRRSTCPATETIPASLLWFLGTASKANSGIKRVFATWEYDLNCLIQSIRNRLPNYTSSKLRQPDDTYFNMFQYFRLHKGSISLFDHPAPANPKQFLVGTQRAPAKSIGRGIQTRGLCRKHAEMQFLGHGRLW